VKVKILLHRRKPFVLSLFFMILLKNFKCDRTRVTHLKNPERTHIRTHKFMKLRTSFALGFPHARVWRTHAHSHTNTLTKIIAEGSVRQSYHFRIANFCLESTLRFMWHFYFISWDFIKNKVDSTDCIYFHQAEKHIGIS